MARKKGAANLPPAAVEKINDYADRWHSLGNARRVANLAKAEVEKAAGREVASDTIQRQIREVWATRTEEDKPWHLGVMEGYHIPWDAAGVLLTVWKQSVLYGWTLTIREAKWVARLRTALDGESPRTILSWAILYAREEHHFETLRQPSLETRFFDAEIAFRPWKDALSMWEYGAAVRTQVVPLPGAHRVWGNPKRDTLCLSAVGIGGPLGAQPGHPHLPTAGESLSEVGGLDGDLPLWFPQARAVMTFWLRWLSQQDEKWKLIGYVGDGEVGAEAMDRWKEATRKFASLVIERAKALTEGREYEWGTWAPYELVEEMNLSLSGPFPKTSPARRREEQAHRFAEKVASATAEREHKERELYGLSFREMEERRKIEQSTPEGSPNKDAEKRASEKGERHDQTR